MTKIGQAVEAGLERSVMQNIRKDRRRLIFGTFELLLGKTQWGHPHRFPKMIVEDINFT